VSGKVVRVEAEDDGRSSSPPRWTIEVVRLEDYQVLSRRTPRRDDVPEDIRHALSVWLAGNQS
jgi:hypothetical protein